MEYHQRRPGLDVLQERIDDFITEHEARVEQVLSWFYMELYSLDIYAKRISTSVWRLRPSLFFIANRHYIFF